MRYIFITILIAIANFSYSQTEQNDTSALIISEVVRVDSTISKDELFNRARAWCSSSFVNSNNALKVQDKEAGLLIGKGSINVTINQLGTTYDYGFVEFDMKILLKDGRYKYEFSNMIHKQTAPSIQYYPYGLLTNSMEAPEDKRCGLCTRKLNNSNWQTLIKSSKDKINALVESMKTAMKMSISGDDKW